MYKTKFKLSSFSPLVGLWAALLCLAGPAWAEPTLQQQAQAALLAKDYTQAQALYQQLLAQMPTHPDLHYQVGSTALLNGDATLARTHLQKALELEPSHLFALNHLGLALIQLKETAAARELYTQSLKQRPLARELWFNLGQLAWEEQDATAARSAWQRAWALKQDPLLAQKLQALPPLEPPVFEPQDALAAYRQAVALEEQGKSEAALKAYGQILSDYPQCAAAAFRRGRLYLAARNDRAAGADFEKVIQWQPDHAAAYFERARLEISAKNLAQAEADLYQLLWLRPDHDPARQLLLQVLTAQNRGLHIVLLLRDYLRLHPDDEAVRLQLLHWELKLGHRAEAWALLTPLAESGQASADVYHLLGKVADLNGQSTQSDTYFAQAFALGPPPPEAQPEAARWLSRQGRAAEALKYLDSYLKTHPRDVQTLGLAGVLAAQQGQGEQAVRWLEQAQKLNPVQSELSKYLALAWLKQGQKEKASQAIRLYLQKNPTAADAVALQELLKTLTPLQKPVQKKN